MNENYDHTAIRLNRQRCRLTTAQVALMLDLSEDEYERIENGQGNLSEATLQKLALLFRVDISELQAQTKPTSKKKTLSKRTRQKRDHAQRQFDPDYVSDEELEEARKTMPDATPESLRFLHLISEIVVSNTLREMDRESKLKKVPNGFRFEEEGFSCWICHGAARGGWYDKYGLKCAACQDAVNKGLIPGEITRNDELYYTEYQLESEFAINKKSAKQFAKAGLIKPRSIPGRLNIYLIAEQNNFLPPKALIKGAWYQNTEDPLALIKDYGIARYLRFSNSPPDSAQKE